MMKTLQVAEDIVPIAELKAHTSQVVDNVRARGRPMVITQHGKPAAVLLSPEQFDRLSYQARFLAAVQEGLADSEAGRVISDDDLGRELDELLGTRK